MLCQSALLTRVARSRASARQLVRAMGEHTYKYPRPSVTVDALVVAKPGEGHATQLLLIQRGNPPCKGQWALPGGFVDENEPLDKAAARELEEETGVRPGDALLTQVGAFGDPGRDPRGWCVSVAYAALVPPGACQATAGDDAAEARWFPLGEALPPLAFDHKLIVRTGLEHLRRHPGARAQGQLEEDLARGIEALQGPWTPPKE